MHLRVADGGTAVFHHRVDAVALVQAEVDDGAHVLGKNVAGGAAALNHGGGDSRRYKGECLRPLCTGRGDRVGVPAHIPDEFPKRLFGDIRGERLKGADHRLGQATGEGMIRNGGNGPGQMLKRAPAERPVGVAAAAFNRELQIGIAFLHQLDQADGEAGGPEAGAVFQFAAALIQNEFQPDTPAFQGFGNIERSEIQSFLIITEGKIGCAAKAFSVGEQVFRCFQNAENHLFNIQRAASPDVSVLHSTGESVIGPVLLRAGDDRDHILMRHVQTGEKRGIRTRNGDQHCMADELKLTLCHDRRKAVLDHCLQPVKFRKIRPAVVFVVHRSAADRIREMGDRSVHIQIRIKSLVVKIRKDLIHSSLSSR